MKVYKTEIKIIWKYGDKINHTHQADNIREYYKEHSNVFADIDVNDALDINNIIQFRRISYDKSKEITKKYFARNIKLIKIYEINKIDTDDYYFNNIWERIH